MSSVQAPGLSLAAFPLLTAAAFPPEDAATALLTYLSLPPVFVEVVKVVVVTSVTTMVLRRLVVVTPPVAPSRPTMSLR